MLAKLGIIGTIPPWRPPPTEFSKQKYAICWAKTASLNRKSIYSIIKSLEKKYKGDGQYENVIEHLSSGILEEFKIHFNGQKLSECPAKLIELIVASFIDADVSRPILNVYYIFSGKLHSNNVLNNTRISDGWKNAPANDFGACWIGEKEYISHIVNHKNSMLPPLKGQFEIMTLEDAKEYARFLVEYTCDFQRFSPVVPTCGRPLIIAKLTPDKYEEIVF